MKITLPEFEDSLGEAQFPLAIATSGGADSLALLLLSQALAKKKKKRILALTVDHSLRPDSKREALQVQAWAHEKGIEHIILEWKETKPFSHLQERAREARYRLLIDWCKTHQIPTLLLGHHQQDQEETFWLRLSSGSGLDGLAGMKKRTIREGISFLRPFLEFSKERLKATLLAERQEWIEDPSNQSPNYFRGRFRTILKEEGLSSPRLSHVMKKLKDDADFIRSVLLKSIETHVKIHEEGYLTLDAPIFNDLHLALKKRFLSFLIQWFSGASYPPRSQQVSMIMDKLNKEVPFTSGGVYWVRRHCKIYLFREVSAIKHTLALQELSEETLWDQRFLINPEIKNYVPQDASIAALTYCFSSLREKTSPLPRRIWPSLPSIWSKGKVVAIPHLCYNEVSCEKDLRKFIYLKPLFHN